MPEKPFKNIKIILDDLTKKYGLDIYLKEEKLFCEWESIVGNSVGKHSAPQCIEHRILFLEVKDSFWKQVISIKKKEIIKLISNQLGKNFINKIKFI